MRVMANEVLGYEEPKIKSETEGSVEDEYEEEEEESEVESEAGSHVSPEQPANEQSEDDD